MKNIYENTYLNMFKQQELPKYVVIFHPENNDNIENIGEFNTEKEAIQYMDKDAKRVNKGEVENISPTTRIIRGYGKYIINTITESNQTNKQKFIQILNDIVAEAYALGYDSCEKNISSNPLKNENILDMFGSLEALYDDGKNI